MTDDIQTACTILLKGGIIAMPTETVYGLAGDATNEAAVQKIYEIKARPHHNPLIIHCADREAITAFAEITPTAAILFKHFSPGPLTLILPLKEASAIAKNATAGLPTIAVRIPAHPFAQQLLRQLPFPLAAPSANLSGYLSPTQASHCNNLGVPVFDGGECLHGLESTIIDASRDRPCLLRHGSIAEETIGEIVPLSPPPATDKPISPGQLLHHYAPRLPLKTDVTEPLESDAYIAFGDCPHRCFRNLSPTGDLTEAAHNLFACLRDADNSGKQRIAVAPIPKDGLGLAIDERLLKAKKNL